MVTLCWCVCFFMILSTALSNNKTAPKNLTKGDIIMEDQKSLNFLLKGNVIPIIQQRMNNEAVKRSMDNFSMVRRKTHFLMPGVHVNSVTVNGHVVNPGSIRGTSYRTVNIESYKYNGQGYDKVKDIRQELVITKSIDDVFNKIDKNRNNFRDKDRNFDRTNDINHNFVNVNGRGNVYNNIQGLRGSFVKNKMDDLDEIDNLHSNLLNMQSRGYFEPMNDINNFGNKKNVYAKFNQMHQNFIVKNKPGPSDKIKVLTNDFGNNNNKLTSNKATEGNYAKLNNINENLNPKTGQKKPIAEYYNEIRNIYEKFKNHDFDDYFTYEQEQELLKILRKQEEIIKNITENTATTKKKKKPKKRREESKEWEDMLKKLEEHRNKTKNATEFTFETTTVSTTTTTTARSTTLKPATILTVLNEIDVRTALKNDPYVKRILKIANKKRQKYIKNALLTIYN